MFSIDLSRYRLPFLLAWGLATLSFIGCNNKTVDEGVERGSKNKPEYFSREDVIAESQSQVTLEAGDRFLSPTEAVAVRVHVRKLRENESLAGIPWQKIKLPGDETLPVEVIENLDFAWFLFSADELAADEQAAETDRSTGEEPAGKAAPTGLFVLDFTEPFLEKPDFEIEAPWVVKNSAPKQFLVGDETRIQAAISNTQPHPKFPLGSSPVWKGQSELTIAIHPSSIVPELEEMLAGSGADPAQAELLQTLESADYILVDVTLAGKHLLVAKAQLPDSEAAKNLEEPVLSAIDSIRTMSGFIVATALGGDDPMSKELKKAVTEILVPSSIQVEAKNNVLELTVKRPSNLDTLLDLWAKETTRSIEEQPETDSSTDKKD